MDSKAITSPALLKPDKEHDEPVFINELFRKARRNSLVWSFVAILAVFGKPVTRAGEPASEALVPLYPLSLGFGKPFLVLVSLAVATFMYFGFRRALHALNLLNSIRAKKRGYDNLPSMLRDLAKDAEEANDVLKEALDKIEETRRISINERRKAGKFQRRVSGIVSLAVGKIIANLNGSTSPGSSIPPKNIASDSHIYSIMQTQARIISKAEEQLEGLREQLEESVAEIMDEDVFHQSALTAPDVSQFLSVSEALKTAANEITNHERSSNDTEGKWHRRYDLLPTHVLYWFALVLSTSFLIASAWARLN